MSFIPSEGEISRLPEEMGWNKEIPAEEDPNFEELRTRCKDALQVLISTENLTLKMLLTPVYAYEKKFLTLKSDDKEEERKSRSLALNLRLIASNAQKDLATGRQAVIDFLPHILDENQSN